jgi:hypothetical protein
MATERHNLFKVIACEIALREICHVAAQSPHLVDLEFLTQGYHDVPAQGRDEIQRRIDAVPAGRYDAILIGYGLCSNILTGLHCAHTPLVIPRAHDCITLFLGSKERYQELFEAKPGAYYYTSGWLECVRRRGVGALQQGTTYMPSNFKVAADATYAQWVEKYGEEQAQYLREVMGGWAASYNAGVLIDFDFTRQLGLREQVERICADQSWRYEELPGDLSLFRRWLAGEWNEEDFLVVPPGQSVEPSHDSGVIRCAGCRAKGVAPVAEPN